MGSEYNNLRVQLGKEMSEVQYWKMVAIYLADCHGANSHIVDLKRTARYERSRLVSIMRKCRSWLLKTAPAPSNHFRNAETVAKDLGKIIASLEEHHPEVKEGV